MKFYVFVNVNICVEGICSTECVGEVTPVTSDYCILYRSEESVFRGRHIVTLPIRGPPLYGLNRAYQKRISSDKLDKVEKGRALRVRSFAV